MNCSPHSCPCQPDLVFRSRFAFGLAPQKPMDRCVPAGPHNPCCLPAVGSAILIRLFSQRTPQGTDPMKAAAPALYPPGPARSASIPHLRRGLSPASPRLSIIIVNYRSWEDTARLVSQLQAAESLRRGAVEIIVVDNHSPPHPLARRLRRAEGVSLRRWSRNRGFGRAVNEGVRLGRGHWFLLLNPDLTVDPRFLDGVLDLVSRLDRDSHGPGGRIGVVGLGVDNPDGSRQPSTGPFPTLASTLARLLVPRPWRKCHLCSPRNKKDVPWATGCCLLVRRGVLEDLGGFDPGFFLYYEDVDLCRRASACGWTVRHEPSLRLSTMPLCTGVRFRLTSGC